MKTLLLITSSPKRQLSHSTRLAEHFAEQLQKTDSSWHIDRLDLWETALPPIDEEVLDLRMAIFNGESLSEHQTALWQSFENHIDRFSGAAARVIAFPAWNFGVPYVLKHYIDVVTQPQLSFLWSPASGYQSLLSPKPALLIASCGADFQLTDQTHPNNFAFQYVITWLKVYMACDPCTVFLPSTAMGAEALEQNTRQAFAEVSEFARTFNTID